jgi:hypothetical protein
VNKTTNAVKLLQAQMYMFSIRGNRLFFRGQSSEFDKIAIYDLDTLEPVG